MNHKILPWCLAVVISFVAPSAWADASQELKVALNKLVDQTEYRLNVTVSGQPETVVDVQLPNKLHIKNAQMEMVMINDAVWMNMAGQWMAVPKQATGNVNLMEKYDPEAVRKTFHNISDLSVVGNEQVKGCESTLYQYKTTEVQQGKEYVTDSVTAVCGATGLPVRMNTTSQGMQSTVHYDFDADINIQAPK